MGNETTAARTVKVIGHRNPDTDSICSAIAYSRLKTAVDGTHSYEPCRAGLLNRETEFVLEHFGAQPPQLYTDVAPQIRDVDVRRVEGVDGEMSLRRAWTTMRDEQIDTLCVLDGEGRLQGLVTTKDVAVANMDLLDDTILAKAGTSYQNVVDTLGATVLAGDVAGKKVAGRIVIGAGNAELMERAISKGDIVIVSNRSDSQLTAIEMDAGCIVVCADSKVSSAIQTLAEERGCLIIATPHPTYICGQMITQAAPIRYYMTSKEGRYLGVVSRRNLMNMQRKQLILVDHNEKAQAVEGLEEAEVLEIVDHHRIGALETDGPIYFRNLPVGCTCTIIYQMYREYGVDIDRSTAGLMLSAILSDTLMFRSPTCTAVDEQAARDLARIAGVELEQYADEMFERGGDITGKTADEILNTDYKIFSSGDVRFGVGQATYMSENNRKASEALVGPYLQTALEKQKLDYIFCMFTDIRTSATELMMAGEGAEELIGRAFGAQVVNGVADLPGVVSRKKQMIPALLGAIKQGENG